MQIDPARTALININPQVALLHLDPTGRASEAVQAVSSEGVQTAQVTPRRRTTSDPTVLEVAEQTMLLAGGIAVAAPIFPGFLLCIPGLVVFIAPVIAMGLLAAAAGFVILLAVVPVLVTWRLARRVRRAVTAMRAPRAATVRPRPQLAGPNGGRLGAATTTASSPTHHTQLSAHSGMSREE